MCALCTEVPLGRRERQNIGKYFSFENKRYGRSSIINASAAVFGEQV
jgi:hypothetical protein